MRLQLARLVTPSLAGHSSPELEDFRSVFGAFQQQGALRSMSAQDMACMLMRWESTKRPGGETQDRKTLLGFVLLLKCLSFWLASFSP